MQKTRFRRTAAAAALTSTFAAGLIALAGSPAHATAQSFDQQCATANGWQVCVSYNYDNNNAAANAQNLSNATKTGHLTLYPSDRRWVVDKAYTWAPQAWHGHPKADSRRTRYCAQLNPTNGDGVVICWPFTGEPFSSR